MLLAVTYRPTVLTASHERSVEVILHDLSHPVSDKAFAAALNMISGDLQVLPALANGYENGIACMHLTVLTSLPA